MMKHIMKTFATLAMAIILTACAHKNPQPAPQIQQYNPPAMHHVTQLVSAYHPQGKLHKLLPLTVTMYPGSLKTNVSRLARFNGHWNLIWTADDYTWVGKSRITATDFQSALMTIIKNYPLQAVFYEGNHVLLIKPRTMV